MKKNQTMKITANVKKKNYHKNTKQKYAKSAVVKKQFDGPPLKVEDYSTNWKKFLNNQIKNPQPITSKHKQTTGTEIIAKKGKFTKEKSIYKNGTEINEKKGKFTNEKSIIKNGTEIIAKKGKYTNEKSINKKLNIAKDKQSTVNNPRKENTKRKREDENSVEISHKHNKINNTKLHRKKQRTINQDETQIENDSSKIWFDVDPKLLPSGCDLNVNNADKNKSTDIAEKKKEKEKEIMKSNLTRYVAIDCEMVGVGYEGKESVLARVSIVNSLGECVYDKFVKPQEKVVDYRTKVSGVRSSDLKNAVHYDIVQKEVNDLLTGRILVGHALQNDLKVLMLSHSKKNIRDTSKYKPFRKLLKTKRPALKKLANEILHEKIQCGEHDSVVDARVTMQLYKKYKKDWEKSLRMKGESNDIVSTEIYMGGGDNSNAKKKKKNKWKKIKDRKKQKENNE